MTATDEARWLSLAGDGDETAFARLMETYERPVFNLCYRMLGDPEEAEDAAQETFLRAFLALKRYDPTRSFATWLLSIAAHYCIDRLRRKRLSLVPLREALRLDRGGEGMPDPEMLAVAAERRGRVQRMLDRLGPKERAAVVMRYWYDMSYQEIADTLSMSVSAAKSRLHRARRTLAESWEDEGMRNPHPGGKRNEAPAV